MSPSEKRKIVPCPYCIVKGTEEEGCCACDYCGRVYEDTVPSIEHAAEIVKKYDAMNPVD